MVEQNEVYDAPDADLLEPHEQARVDQGIEAISQEKAAELEEDFKKKNRLSLGLGLLGIFLQAMVGGVAALFGTLVLIAAFVVYAQMRGRSPWWGALGFLSIIGFIVLYFLGKNCAWCGEKNSHRADRCESCGAPLAP